MINLTISARFKKGAIQNFLSDNFGTVELSIIESLFGFNDPCVLYGGRSYADTGKELTDEDLIWMYSNNIGYRIPLTSYFFSEEMYEQSKSFLDKHHRIGNSVIVTKDALAKRIRKDYPLYKIEASVIKETDTLDKLYKRLEIYDTIVPLPEAFNTNYELLQSIECKDRIRLFLNMGCAYKCPARICYKTHSKNNRGDTYSYQCSQQNGFKQTSMVSFDFEKYLSLGYTNFKLLRVKNSKTPTGY